MNGRSARAPFRFARLSLTAGALAVIAACSAPPAWAAGNCYFKPVRPVVLKTMGPCDFDPDTLTFAGTAGEQAKCLLRPVRPLGKIGPPLTELPAPLARVGTSADLPNRATLLGWLKARGLEDTFAATLADPVARPADGKSPTHSATYFVIHDTSAPNYGSKPWPVSLDTDGKINNLSRYTCDNDIERAHIFINRPGEILSAHDFAVPWRATKFEMATRWGVALKGLFLHIELVQPRKRMPGRGARNDFLAPEPGFTPDQYDALALVYAVASVRAGFWMIPAFHAVLDDGIYDKHDDPQNFELATFAASLEQLLDGDVRRADNAPVD